MNESKLRCSLCEIGQRLWQRGLVGAAEGNISVRLDQERLLCTPAGVSKGHLSPEDLVVIDGEGTPIGPGWPSSEIKLHLCMYRARPDCNAVIHAHPITATALSLVGETIPDDLLPEAMFVLGNVALVPFTMPGTDEVPEALQPLLATHTTFLLSHHGAATMGSDLTEAYNRMETLERVAKMVVTARLLGSIKPLTANSVGRLQALILGVSSPSASE